MRGHVGDWGAALLRLVVLSRRAVAVAAWHGAHVSADGGVCRQPDDHRRPAADLRAIHDDRRRTARSDAFDTWTNPFASPRWAAIAPGYAHLVLVPPPHCGAAPQPYEAAVRLASQHGLTLNAGVIARGDVGAQRRYCADLDARIDAGTLDADTLYVMSKPGGAALTDAAGDRVVCGRVDTVWICTASEAHARWRAAAPLDQ